MHTDVLIIGGGASGLAACAALADSGLRITLAERLDRVGKKILSTGNGRCNLSNEDMNPDYYGDAAPFVRKLYRETPPQEVLSFFERLGLMTAREDSRIYPRTMAAASVLDVLRACIENERVTLLTGRQVVSLSRSRRGGWSASLDSGEGVFAQWVIFAAGGCAAPSMGTDGSGYAMLASLGHDITPRYPALVQLKCDHRALKSLKGVRIQAGLTLEIAGQHAAQENGELLFADYGVSGVCIFQLSRHVAKAIEEKKPVRLLVNLLPEIPQEDLDGWLSRRIALRPDASAQSLLTGVFHRLLAQAVLREAGISPEEKAADLCAEEQAALLRCVHSFVLPVAGTQGFAQAQVTRGGVTLSDVDPATMASRIYGDLYITGEALDVDGPCGGYNLHFAFAGGLTAAKTIRSQLVF